MDASRFDQHVSPAMLRWEHKQWIKMVPDPDKPKLKKLLDMQLKNKGSAKYGDKKIAYEVEGCRMSGDMNTSSGNVMIMVAMLWTYCQAFCEEFRIVNDGDDSVVILPRAHLKKLNGIPVWFQRLGFRMEVEKPVDVFEQIEFCQTQPVLTRDGYRMVR